MATQNKKLSPVGYDPQLDPDRIIKAQRIRLYMHSRETHVSGDLTWPPLSNLVLMQFTKRKAVSINTNEMIKGYFAELAKEGYPLTAQDQWEGSVQLNARYSVTLFRLLGLPDITWLLIPYSTTQQDFDITLTGWPEAPEWGGAFTLLRENHENWADARLSVEPALRVLVESDECIDTGTRLRTHVINADPTMPKVTIRAPIVGLTKDEEDAVERRYTLKVTYQKGNRHDVLEIPHTGAGPKWEVDWDGKFVGGDLTVHVEATLPSGEKIKADAEGKHQIWGTNPAKADIRAVFADTAELVSIYRESRFTQFSKTTSPASLQRFQGDPLPVLRSFDNGFGIGQLTNGPDPTVDDLWNWTTNANDAADRFPKLRRQVNTHITNTRITDPQTPAMTQDQLDLEMWKLYNSGHYYHTYKKSTHTWIPHPNAYADECLTMRNNVDAGTLPPGWD